MRIGFIIILWSLLALNAFSQSTDTLLLAYNQYLEGVLNHHPLMVQAGLFEDQAKAYRLKARGYFDPKLDASFSSKDFDKKDYYQLINGALKIPTWIGADLKVAYENNRGQFLDNSDFLPDAGLIAAGIEIPLGQGLFFDERRKALKDAVLYRELNEVKRTLLINDLLFDASTVYTKWQNTYNLLVIRQEGLEIAERRLEMVRNGYLVGDSPAIDTLESFIAVQNRTNDLIKAQQYFNYASQDLNNFLWLNGNIPLELDDNTVPESIRPNLFQARLDSIALVKDMILSNHPELRKYDINQAGLELDQRLNREYLKPRLNVAYNPLIRVDDRNPVQKLVTENYKLGFDFAYPLFTRKERANIQITDIAMQENMIQRDLKAQSLNIKLQILLDNERFLSEQVNLLAATARNYERLLEAEFLKLSIGESSVFLINSREMKYLESREKLINARTGIIENRLALLNIAVITFEE
jgi:outer membrane protein TolC